MNSISVSTEVNRIEIVLKNLILGNNCFKFEGKECFPDLAIPGSILGEECNLRVLLRDRGTTLGATPREVIERCTGNTQW